MKFVVKPKNLRGGTEGGHYLCECTYGGNSFRTEVVIADEDGDGRFEATGFIFDTATAKGPSKIVTLALFYITETKGSGVVNSNTLLNGRSKLPVGSGTFDASRFESAPAPRFLSIRSEDGIVLSWGVEPYDSEAHADLDTSRNSSAGVRVESLSDINKAKPASPNRAAQAPITFAPPYTGPPVYANDDDDDDGQVRHRTRRTDIEVDDLIDQLRSGPQSRSGSRPAPPSNGPNNRKNMVSAYRAPSQGPPLARRPSMADSSSTDKAPPLVPTRRAQSAARDSGIPQSPMEDRAASRPTPPRDNSIPSRKDLVAAYGSGASNTSATSQSPSTPSQPLVAPSLASAASPTPSDVKSTSSPTGKTSARAAALAAAFAAPIVKTEAPTAVKATEAPSATMTESSSPKSSSTSQPAYRQYASQQKATQPETQAQPQPVLISEVKEKSVSSSSTTAPPPPSSLPTRTSSQPAPNPPLTKSTSSGNLDGASHVGGGRHTDPLTSPPTSSTSFTSGPADGQSRRDRLVGLLSGATTQKAVASKKPADVAKVIKSSEVQTDAIPEPQPRIVEVPVPRDPKDVLKVQIKESHADGALVAIIRDHVAISVRNRIHRAANIIEKESTMLTATRKKKFDKNQLQSDELLALVSSELYDQLGASYPKTPQHCSLYLREVMACFFYDVFLACTPVLAGCWVTILAVLVQGMSDMTDVKDQQSATDAFFSAAPQPKAGGLHHTEVRYLTDTLHDILQACVEHVLDADEAELSDLLPPIRRDVASGGDQLLKFLKTNLVDLKGEEHHFGTWGDLEGSTSALKASEIDCPHEESEVSIARWRLAVQQCFLFAFTCLVKGLPEQPSPLLKSVLNTIDKHVYPPRTPPVTSDQWLMAPTSYSGFTQMNWAAMRNEAVFVSPLLHDAGVVDAGTATSGGLPAVPVIVRFDARSDNEKKLRMQLTPNRLFQLDTSGTGLVPTGNPNSFIVSDTATALILQQLDTLYVALGNDGSANSSTYPLTEGARRFRSHIEMMRKVLQEVVFSACFEVICSVLMNRIPQLIQMRASLEVPTEDGDAEEIDEDDPSVIRMINLRVKTPQEAMKVKLQLSVFEKWLQERGLYTAVVLGGAGNLSAHERYSVIYQQAPVNKDPNAESTMPPYTKSAVLFSTVRQYCDLVILPKRQLKHADKCEEYTSLLDPLLVYHLLTQYESAHSQAVRSGPAQEALVQSDTPPKEAITRFALAAYNRIIGRKNGQRSSTSSLTSNLTTMTAGTSRQHQITRDLKLATSLPSKVVPPVADSVLSYLRKFLQAVHPTMSNAVWPMDDDPNSKWTSDEMGSAEVETNDSYDNSTSTSKNATTISKSGSSSKLKTNAERTQEIVFIASWDVPQDEVERACQREGWRDNRGGAQGALRRWVMKGKGKLKVDFNAPSTLVAADPKKGKGK